MSTGIVRPAVLSGILDRSQKLRRQIMALRAELQDWCEIWKARLRIADQVPKLESQRIEEGKDRDILASISSGSPAKADIAGTPQPNEAGAASQEASIAPLGFSRRKKLREELPTRVSKLYEVSVDPSRSVPMEGLRGLAVLLVFFVHYDGMYSSYLTPGSGLFTLARFWGLVGNTGVDLFFVLSGYLIYGALLRKRGPYLKFIKRRAERIYPTFLCVLVLYLAASVAAPHLSKIHGSVLSGAALILANALLLPGIFQITAIVTVAWSLSYEFFFYITIPLVVHFTGMADWKRRWRIIFFASVGIGYLAYSFTVPTSHVRLLMFLAGILLYETISSNACKGPLRKGIGDYLVGGLFAASLVLVYALDSEKWLTFLPRIGNTVLPGVLSYEGPYKVIALTLGCVPFALFCIAGQGLLARVFSWAPARYLGNMSYSFYLLHGATLNAFVLLLHHIIKPDGNSPILFCAMFPVAFSLSWVTSTVLFALVEKPISLRARPKIARIILEQQESSDRGTPPKEQSEMAPEH